MFTLSDDKSAYGTLKGLVEALEKDKANVMRRHARASSTLRSHDAMKASGEISAYNMTIALIMTTDVWIVGQRAENVLEHWHVVAPNGSMVRSDDESLIRDWLESVGAPTNDAFSLASAGFAITHCQDRTCTEHGDWLARRVPVSG